MAIESFVGMSGLIAAVSAARGTGLLEAVIKTGGTSEDLASRLKLNSRACSRVLEVLRAFDIIQIENGVYGPSVKFSEFMRVSPEQDVSQIIEFWETTSAFLKEGKGVAIM